MQFVAHAEMMRFELRRSVKWLVSLAVASAVGIGLFAWAAHPA